MPVIAKSKPEIHLRQSVRKYDFFVVPGALFAAYGTLLITLFIKKQLVRLTKVVS